MAVNIEELRYAHEGKGSGAGIWVYVYKHVNGKIECNIVPPRGHGMKSK